MAVEVEPEDQYLRALRGQHRRGEGPRLAAPSWGGSGEDVEARVASLAAEIISLMQAGRLEAEENRRREP